MQIAAFAVAKNPGEFEDFLLACRQQLLGCKFRRGAEVTRQAPPAGLGEFGSRCMQVRLVARRNLQNSSLDLGKTQLLEPGPNHLGNGATRRQKRPAVSMSRPGPPRRRLVDFAHRRPTTEPLPSFRKSMYSIDIILFSP